jgi:anthranilate phosphoribosyltransferase
VAGIAAASVNDVRGGDAAENAKTLTGILSGEVTGPKADLAVVNAGGAFVVAGLAKDLGEGIWYAREQIKSGRALKKLEALQAFQ